MSVLTVAASAALEAFEVPPESRVALISRIAKAVAFALMPISLVPLFLRGWLMFTASANPLVGNVSPELGARARELHAKIERNESRVALVLCCLFGLMSLIPMLLHREFIFDPGSTPKTIAPPSPAHEQCVKKIIEGNVTREAAEALCNCAAHMTKEHECDAELKAAAPQASSAR